MPGGPDWLKFYSPEGSGLNIQHSGPFLIDREC